MAEHGYAREYDGDFDRGEDRERAWHDSDWDDWNRGNRERGFLFGDEGRGSEGRRSFRSHPDDHYRSWRRKQIEALDRDYADYCREREEQFHNEFDSWRSQRRGDPELSQTGMTQTGPSHDPSGELQLTNEIQSASQKEPGGMGTATLETTSGGRTRK